MVFILFRSPTVHQPPQTKTSGPAAAPGGSKATPTTSTAAVLPPEDYDEDEALAKAIAASLHEFPQVPQVRLPCAELA